MQDKRVGANHSNITIRHMLLQGEIDENTMVSIRF